MGLFWDSLFTSFIFKKAVNLRPSVILSALSSSEAFEYGAWRLNHKIERELSILWHTAAWSMKFAYLNYKTNCYFL